MVEVQTPEVVLEKEVLGGEFVDTEDILGLQTSTINGMKGKQVKNKPRVITRSGRVVKVVDKDNLYIVVVKMGLIRLLGRCPVRYDMYLHYIHIIE